MDKYNVGILGATGAVGREMLKILRERSFPVGELRLLASKRSAGQEIDGHEVLEACAENFRGLNIVLGAAENNIAAAFADDIKAAGAVFVDNSSAFRLCPDVPLVVPEINPEDVKKHSGIIANPNCTTTITCTAISALRRLSPIESMVVSSYQAVSGAGSAGPQELFGEIEAVAAGRSCTCVRVPVVRSHSVSVQLKTREKLTIDDARAAIAAAPGCKLLDELDDLLYPMPLLSTDQDLVLVGRIREDLTDDQGLLLWCCGDQLRKGAATNAVQIAELLTG